MLWLRNGFFDHSYTFPTHISYSNFTLTMTTMWISVFDWIQYLFSTFMFYASFIVTNWNYSNSCVCVCVVSSAIICDFFLLFCSNSTGWFHLRFILSLTSCTSHLVWCMVYGQSRCTWYFESRYQHELWWHQHLKLIFGIIYWMGNLEKCLIVQLSGANSIQNAHQRIFQIPNENHMFYV